MSHSTLMEFEAVYPELLQFLTSPKADQPEPVEALDHLQKVIEYNVPFGKKIRGMSVVRAYEHIIEEPTEEDLALARVIGWCVELLQASALILDDIMDNSETRRGQICWYKKEDIGMLAINDGVLMHQVLYIVLQKYIRDKPYYVDIMDLFLKIQYQTSLGQYLDLSTASADGKPDYTRFTMARYSYISTWKTSFYTFYLPVAAALYMAGIQDDTSHSNAKAILFKIGHFCQVQDDYLDCFGDPSVTGKIGTDIQDSKCSWLMVNALKMASQEQIQIMKDNYGSWDEARVAKVKKVFSDLDLQGLYRDFEETSYNELVDLIASETGKVPKQIFLDFVTKLYKRDK